MQPSSTDTRLVRLNLGHDGRHYGPSSLTVAIKGIVTTTTTQERRKAAEIVGNMHI
jgi:hypothetical protein